MALHLALKLCAKLILTKGWHELGQFLPPRLLDIDCPRRRSRSGRPKPVTAQYSNAICTCAPSYPYSAAQILICIIARGRHTSDNCLHACFDQLCIPKTILCPLWQSTELALCQHKFSLNWAMIRPGLISSEFHNIHSKFWCQQCD